MAEQFLRPYVDACVYIEMLMGEHSKEPEKASLAADLLQLAESCSFNVYASTFMEAEVVKGADEKALTETQEERISKYFEADFIVWYDVDHSIAQNARRIVRDHGMKPPDAVHVATALRAGCDQFLTWDDKLHKDQDPGRNVEGLMICVPHLTGYPTPLFHGTEVEETEAGT